MTAEYSKILFVAADRAGHETWLVRLRDARWGILVDGRLFAMGWPDGLLGPATRAYSEMIMTSQAQKGELHE